MTKTFRKTMNPFPAPPKLKSGAFDTAIKKTLKESIDELGLCNAILAPFADTLKKQGELKEKVKSIMDKLDVLKAEGKNFEAVRKLVPTEVLDREALEKVVGDLGNFKKDSTRVYLTVTKKTPKGQ